jgi:DNA-binding MarR family transcriptional regulator
VSLDRAGNLLGVLALSVADRTAEAVGHPPSTAAALIALKEFLVEPSVDRLKNVLGLTPSGTVRLVDRLEQQGWVQRGPGPDGRTVALRLTDAGRAEAEKTGAARGAVLEGVLSTLNAEERSVLEGLLETLTPGLMRGPGATRWMCRMCDMTACGRPEGRCPVANAARARYGQSRQ